MDETKDKVLKEKGGQGMRGQVIRPGLVVSASGVKHGSRIAGQNASYDDAATIAEVKDMPFRVNRNDAARILRRHPDTVGRLARSGKIPGAVFESGTWMFSTKMLLDYVEGRIDAKGCPR